MPLRRIPNLGFGLLRAKLAKAAKKVVKSRRYGSPGPKPTTLPSPPDVEMFEEKNGESLLKQSPHATTKLSTPCITKPVFAPTFTFTPTTLIITPTQADATIHLTFLDNSPTTSEACSQIGVTPLEQPWFSRRRSSLMRISAANMVMSDVARSVRSPASRRHEYIPLTADTVRITSEGIEMEMDDFLPKPNAESFKASLKDLDDADDNASTLTFEYVSFLVVHRANSTRFVPSTVSRDRSDSTISTPLSPKSTTTPKTPKPKPRPAPLPLATSSMDDYYVNADNNARLTPPLPVQDHFCLISDSPGSFCSAVGAWPDTHDGRRTAILFWPGTARSSVSFVRSRPGTAGSEGSEGSSRYRSRWW